MTVVNNIQKTYNTFLTFNWVQKLVVVVILLLTATLIFRTLTPAQAPLQTAVVENITASPVNLQNIDFKGAYPAIPSQLPTATIEYKNIKEELLQNILTAFSISSTPTATDVWKGSQYQVAKTEGPELYVIARITPPENTNNPNNQINTQVAMTEATKIVQGLYPEGPKPALLPNQVEILGQDGDALDGGVNGFFIKIPFAFSLEQIPIYIEKNTNYAAYIILDTKYELLKAELQPYSIEFSQSRNYSTILPTEALGRINQNQAAVISYFYEGPNFADFSQINSGLMTNANIQYRADLNTNTLVPYYSFSGVVKNSEGYDIETEIITPAIKTNFSPPSN